MELPAPVEAAKDSGPAKLQTERVSRDNASKEGTTPKAPPLLV